MLKSLALPICCLAVSICLLIVLALLYRRIDRRSAKMRYLYYRCNCSDCHLPDKSVFSLLSRYTRRYRFLYGSDYNGMSVRRFLIELNSDEIPLELKAGLTEYGCVDICFSRLSDSDFDLIDPD